MLFELKQLNEHYPNDKTINNFTRYSEARLLKFGNLHKRAKSALIFEELINIYPINYDIVKEYLELLFEDFLISEDQETIEKIYFLMNKVYNFPLIFNSIFTFVFQQIIFARYQFFIKDNITSAFEILNEAKEKISP